MSQYKVTRPCLIEGCCNRYYRRGYCWRHYFEYEATQEEKQHRADKAREYSATTYARKTGRERALAWARANKEKVQASNKKYREANSAKVSDYQKRSHAKFRKRFGVSRSAKHKPGYVVIDKGTKVLLFVTGAAQRFQSQWHVPAVRVDGGEEVLVPTKSLISTETSRVAFMSSRDVRRKLGCAW